MEIWRVSGTPAELREAGFLDLIAQGMSGEQAQAEGEVPDKQAINQFVTRARNEYRSFVRTFLDTVRGWEGCTIGSTTDRYVRIESRPGKTIAYIYPRRPSAEIPFEWD